jgi:hypothetical protein
MALWNGCGAAPCMEHGSRYGVADGLLRLSPPE